MQMALAPGRVLKNEAEEERAETARLSAFVGAIAIGDLVKSTLGPKGMDKILVGGSRAGGDLQVCTERFITNKTKNIQTYFQSYSKCITLNQVTNDGATILKSLGIDNPAAKVLVDISKVQDDEVGDGTTSVVVLACELLKEAERLISLKIHPQTIIAGFRKVYFLGFSSCCNQTSHFQIQNIVTHYCPPRQPTLPARL